MKAAFQSVVPVRIGGGLIFAFSVGLVALVHPLIITGYTACTVEMMIGVSREYSMQGTDTPFQRKYFW